jgi:hypothetical protein
MLMTRKIEELVKLLKHEGLDGFLDVAYGYGVLTSSAIGDVSNALKYTKLAADAVFLRSGPNTADFRMWNGITDAQNLK